MRMKTKRAGRGPVVAIAGVLGAFAVVACGGDAEPGGKVGGGLDSGAKGGTTGSGAKGSGGTAGTISIGQGGTLSIGQGGTVSSTGGSSATSGTGGECAKIVSDTSKIDVALLFMVDISGSMTCPVPELTPACTTQP